MADTTIRRADADQRRRQRLCAPTEPPAPPADLAAAIRARVATLRGVTLDLPPREPMREPPCFSASIPCITM